MRIFRKVILLVCVLGFCYLKVFSQNIQDIEFGTNETFEVVTWNIEWFPKDGNTTVGHVKEIITAIDADVFAIQEIDDTAVFRQMINEIDGYELFIYDSYFRGLGFVYKTDLIELVDAYRIFNTGEYQNQFPRRPLVLEIAFKGNKYIVINNHFKCCGDGYLDTNDSYDEENRRYKASNLLKTYIDNFFTNERVILVGDLNDEITNSEENNVFRNFINDADKYLFADMDIAKGASADWSYPSWPSHLDHILITNELFADFENEKSEIQVIKVDDYIDGGWNAYDSHVSDHRPVGIKIKPVSTMISQGLAYENFQVSCYPNPFSDYININVDSMFEPGIVEIYNTLGERVCQYSLKSGRCQIKAQDLNGLNGIYFVRIKTTDENLFLQKIILN